MAVVTLADREQGLLVAPGNPKRLSQLADLAQDGVRMINREPGSGTRTWLDARLTELDMDGESVVGWDSITRTHAGVAFAVTSGKADVGIAPRSAALSANLDFVPLLSERYDLVFDQNRIDETRIQQLLDTLDTRSFRNRADGSHGYDTERTGSITLVE
jgi:putative molybdopterin biosynthesis protein